MSEQKKHDWARHPTKFAMWCQRYGCKVMWYPDNPKEPMGCKAKGA